MTNLKDTPKKYSQEYCYYKHQLVKKDIGKVKKDTEEIKNLIKDVNISLTREVKEGGGETNQKIQFFQAKNNEKLDSIDEAFRGNGKIGVFEQLRNLNKHIEMLNKRLKQGFWFIILIIIFLVGGSVLGINKKVLGEFFFGKEIPKIEKNVGEKKKNIELKVDEKDIYKNLHEKNKNH